MAMQFIQRELFATIDEIHRVTNVEDIDCDFAKGGTLTSASSPAHVDRLRKEVASWHDSGFDSSDMGWLDIDEIRHIINLATTFGGVFSPHCAALHPLKLVSGLAQVLERRGIQIFENSHATSINTHQVTTPEGSLTARSIVRATEAYTSQLPGHRRAVVPLYSLMVATEPLAKSVWDELGWARRLPPGWSTCQYSRLAPVCHARPSNWSGYGWGIRRRWCGARQSGGTDAEPSHCWY